MLFSDTVSPPVSVPFAGPSERREDTDRLRAMSVLVLLSTRLVHSSARRFARRDRV